MADLDAKTCTKCRKTFSQNNFYNDKSKKDGKRTICIPCSKLNKEDNKEKYAARQRERTAKFNKTLEGKARLRSIALKPASRYSYTKNTARTRGLDFGFTKEDFFKVINDNCFYCGDFFRSSGAGLDRVDNSKGYVPGNVVPCCKDCNQMKADLSQDHFFVHLVKIYAKYIQGREEYCE